MGIREELRKRARFLEAQQEKKAARLEREAAESQEIDPEKIKEAKAARLAHERLRQFSPYLGVDLRCPRCCANGTESDLRPSIDRFAETGDDSLDVFRCSSCGFEISISA